MGSDEIFRLVEAELGVSKTAMLNSQKSPVMDARNIVIIMLNEEGFSNNAIAELTKVHRAAVHHALMKCSGLLQFDKRFKQKYLRCIKRMAEMEERSQ